MGALDKHPLQRACELRLMAAAIELQHMTGAGANLAPIPMVRGETAPRFIAVGTAADIASCWRLRRRRRRPRPRARSTTKAKAATMIEAYPLQWPAGWPRTPVAAQRYGRFGSKKGSQQRVTNVTIAEATARVLAELARMGIDREDVVISTNLVLRLDGLPRSGQAAPRDAGAAVYWQAGAARRVMAIDQYYKVEENLAAIAATLDAMRAIERHGGAQILDRAFTGFAALPPPAAAKTWREVMIFGESTPTREQLRQRYRELARTRHPDRAGGSDAAMSELNVAMRQAEAEIGS